MMLPEEGMATLEEVAFISIDQVRSLIEHESNRRIIARPGRFQFCTA
jgi:hypothetical protein